MDGRWISTCGAYTQRMTVPGGTVPIAAITLVTVHPSYRRRGLLRQMMTHQLEGIANQGAEPVALLWASEAMIYGRFGYGETLSRLRLSGPTRSLSFAPWVEFDGSVGEVDREEFLPVAQRLRESWLAQRPGALERDDAWWQIRLHDPEVWRRGASAYRFVLHFAQDGQPDGYAQFRVKEEGPNGYAEVVVHSVDAATGPAYAGLWRFLLNLDLVGNFSRRDAPVDEPLRLLVTDPRAIRTELTDGTYARLVDVPAALMARRYAAEIDVVIEVADPMLAQNDRAFRLQGGPSGAEVTPSRAAAGCEPERTRARRDLPRRGLPGHAASGRAGHRARPRLGGAGSRPHFPGIDCRFATTTSDLGLIDCGGISGGQRWP